MEELSKCGHSDAESSENKCVGCGLNVGACCGVAYDNGLVFCGVCDSNA